MPSFATADADDSKRSRVKEPPRLPSPTGGRKPVKQIIIWTGIICVIALLINWNVSRLQTTVKSGRGGGSVQSSVSAQGDSQCISAFNGDTPTAVCQAFCNEKFMKFHCKWCKCRACSFCPKGGEAIEEAAKSGANISAGASNASSATSNLSAASAPPATLWNGTSPASSEGGGSLLTVGGASGSASAGASVEVATDGNATAVAADGSAAAATGNNATLEAEVVAGSEQGHAEASVTGRTTAEAAAAQASASSTAPTTTGQPAAGQPGEQPPQTPEEAGAAYAAVVQEEAAGGEELLDEDFGEDGTDADAELLGGAEA